MPTYTTDRRSQGWQPEAEVLEAVRQGRSYYVVLTPEDAALAQRREARLHRVRNAEAVRPVAQPTPWTLLAVLLVASLIVITTWLNPPQPLVLSSWDGQANIVAEARPVSQVISGVAEPQR